MAKVTPPAFIRRLTEASRAIHVVTRLLEEIASLLRQMVHIAGWLILLTSSASLLVHPYVSLKHLVVPGAGALAVLQSLIGPRRQQKEIIRMMLPEAAPMLTVDPLPSEVDADVAVEAPPDRGENL